MLFLLKNHYLTANFGTTFEVLILELLAQIVWFLYLFLQSTPGSKLQKEYKKIINKHKIYIEVVKKEVTEVKNLLQKSDPF